MVSWRDIVHDIDRLPIGESRRAIAIVPSGTLLSHDNFHHPALALGNAHHLGTFRPLILHHPATAERLNRHVCHRAFVGWAGRGRHHPCDGGSRGGAEIQYGLDKPVYVQYSKWVWKILHGVFGQSLEFQKPVIEVISERLLMTIILAGTTALLALWMLWVTFVYFSDIGIGGLFSPEYIEEPWSFGRVLDLISHLWIAVFVIGTTGTAALIRVMRTNLLDELNKPYVVTARAKGMPEWKLILKYPVRLALNSLVSTLGYLLPVLMSGSVIVSVVLSLPTEGPLLLRALLAEDLFVSAASVLFLGTLTVIGTLFSDILLGILDPRIRIGYPGIPRQPAIVTWSGYGRPDSQTLCAARPDVCRIA